MKKFWLWLEGIGQWGSVSLPPRRNSYPYGFPEITLSKDWEKISDILYLAVEQYKKEKSDG